MQSLIIKLIHLSKEFRRLLPKNRQCQQAEHSKKRNQDQPVPPSFGWFGIYVIQKRFAVASRLHRTITVGAILKLGDKQNADSILFIPESNEAI